MWSLLSNNPIAYSLSAFSFKRCLFVRKNRHMYNAVKQNQTEHAVYHSRSTFFSQNLFYKWKCTNKQNHNVQDVTPWAHNGGRSPVLQGKGKVCVGRLQTLCFQRSVSTFTFPIRSLFLLHISTRVHSDTHTSQVSAIYASARIQLQWTQLSSKDSIYWPLFWTGALILYEPQSRAWFFLEGILFFPQFLVSPSRCGLASLGGGVQTQFPGSRLQSVSACSPCRNWASVDVWTQWASLCALRFSHRWITCFEFPQWVMTSKITINKSVSDIIRTTAEMRLGQQSGLCLSAPVLTGYVRIRSPATKTNQIRQAYFLPMTHRSLTDKLLQKHTF